jgi:hypothetical protein
MTKKKRGNKLMWQERETREEKRKRKNRKK